jgi:regulator of sigma E protease
MIITIITFILVLSILIFVHELGHFLMARAIGVHVEEFGFGLPPRIWGKKVGKTIYSLNYLPIGGFVKLAGEDDEEEGSHDLHGLKQKEYFWARSKKERSAILIAGVTMNFLLAVIITFFLLVSGVQEPSGKVRLDGIAAGSPAAAAGLQKNDVVISLKSAITTDTKPAYLVHTPDELISQAKQLAGQPTLLTVSRNGQTFNVVLTPRKSPPKGEGAMGVAISDLVLHKYSIIEAPTKSVQINLERAYLMLAGIVDTVAKLVTFRNVGADVAGPIGIAQVTGQAVKFGFKAVIEFMSLLSLNLAVLNILPIPALDGGRLLFVFIEKVIGRKVRPAFEKQTHQIGMLILLALVALVSVNDILRLARGG